MFNLSNNLSSKFQRPIISGILLGMIITIIIQSSEVGNLAHHFTELTNHKLNNEQRELEKTITESLHSKAVTLGKFISKTAIDPILSLDLDGLRELENIARRDPDVIHAVILKTNKTPFLHKKINQAKNTYSAEFPIKHSGTTLGYVAIALSRELIINKQKQAAEYNQTMLAKIKQSTDHSISGFIKQSIAYFIFLAIFINIFIYVVFNKLVTIPVHQLANTARDIGRGKLDSQVKIINNDELGQLAKTLNNMSASLKESYDKLYKTNNDLIEATIAKDQFLANMSHELRTPLNAVIGMSDLIKVETEDPDTQQKAEIIYDSGKQLLSIIERILEITHIQTNKVNVLPVHFPIDVVINELQTFIENSLSTSGNTFTVHVDKNITEMNSDVMKIKEVLINIISNADKFTRHGKIFMHVSMEMIHGTEQVIFTITDTGIGIPPEALDRIFDPFFQADAGITRRHGGAGLGLAICKKYCEAMGGDIRVLSRKNIGTEVTVWLPADYSSGMQVLSQKGSAS
ncbi:MAG: ATP-binding protein [Gammaproteobacteria bacterium]|nr:ATP-binding protein [Gammaproteobacteria bacterium]